MSVKKSEHVIGVGGLEGFFFTEVSESQILVLFFCCLGVVSLSISSLSFSSVNSAPVELALALLPISRRRLLLSRVFAARFFDFFPRFFSPDDE